MLLENRKNVGRRRLCLLLVATGGALIGGGAEMLATGAASAHGVRPVVRAAAPARAAAVPARPLVHPLTALAHARTRRPAARDTQPKARVAPRATLSLYERTTEPAVLRRQGCRAAGRNVAGVVILDFGRPGWNGHTYGTKLFSGRFAANGTITRGMLAYARGYARCLAAGSDAQITLARGTSNYHPHVPSAYRAGRKWARETMRLSHLLRAAGLAEHVVSAAADDVEPAWDRAFHRTRDFYRGYADARAGYVLYNYGSLDGGVGSIWNARQAFYVASGMRYSRAIPQIYNHAMARQWAALAQVARRRYHRPLRFAGVLTQRTARNGAMKPRDAHKALVRELTHYVGPSVVEVPAMATNIRAAQ